MVMSGAHLEMGNWGFWEKLAVPSMASVAQVVVKDVKREERLSEASMLHMDNGCTWRQSRGQMELFEKGQRIQE